MGSVSNKVIASTSAAAVGCAISQIFIWLLTTMEHVTPPPTVEDAFQVLFVAICTFGAGWMARHTQP